MDAHRGHEPWRSGGSAAPPSATNEFGGALPERRKGDGGKVAVALRLRRETTMTLSWIAARLRMGTNVASPRLLIQVQ